MGIIELFCLLSPVPATMFVSDVGVSPSSWLVSLQEDHLPVPVT